MTGNAKPAQAPEIEATIQASVPFVKGAAKLAGRWVAPGILAVASIVLELTGYGDSKGAWIVSVLFGATLGVAFTAARVDDFKAIADERLREVQRMADEKNGLVNLKTRQTSNRSK